MSVPQKAAPGAALPPQILGPPAEPGGAGRARGRPARGSLRYLPPVTTCPRPRREPPAPAGGQRPARGAEDRGRAPGSSPRSAAAGSAAKRGCKHRGVQAPGAQAAATPDPVTARSEGAALPTRTEGAQRTRQRLRERPPPARRPHRASAAAPGPAAAILCPVYPSALARAGRMRGAGPLR